MEILMNKLTSILATSLMSLCVIIPKTALPCGPGVHIRESDQIWSRLTNEYPAFKYLEETPMFLTYLHLGSIMPDFQWFLPIRQGHSSEFSRYLLQMSMDQDQRFQLIALGHLMHNSVSDPLCEQFWTPTLMASAPLGMISLLQGYESEHGMAEGLTEVFGDPIVGDWDALIDVIFDVYLDGPDAAELGHEAIIWYVESMNAYYGTDTDGQAVWQELVDKIADYESFIAGLGRQGTKDFFKELLGETPKDMLKLLTGDMIARIAGDAAKRNQDYELNIGFVTQSAIVDPDFWNIYQDTLLADLSSFWYIDRLNTFAETILPQDASTMLLGWPSWSQWPMVSGNIMSTMRFLPELYKVTPGLIVDEVQWTDLMGNPVSQVTDAMLTSTLKLRIRFYTAYDFNGDIRLEVKGDLPGLNQALDLTCGQHTESFDLDPRTYVTGARSFIETEFVPGTTPVDGFYFELFANQESKPWFTSNWDEIMASGKVPVYQDIYRNNFATYGKWPPSLPMAPGSGSIDCEFMVMARTFPNGGPIPDISVVIDRSDDGEGTETVAKRTLENGVAAFDLVEPAQYSITGHLDEMDATRFIAVDEDPTALQCPATGGLFWTMLQYHVIPVIWVPGFISGRNDCVVFNTNLNEYWGRVDMFKLTIVDYNNETVIVPETMKKARTRIEVCFSEPLDNGTVIQIKAIPVYVGDAGVGVEGFSGPILVDSTAPIIDDVQFTATAATCDDGAHVLPFRVDLDVTANPGPIDLVELWNNEWQALSFESVPKETPGASRLTVSFDADGYREGDIMLFRLTNRVGVSTEYQIEIPASIACPIIPDAADDVVQDLNPTTDSDAFDSGAIDLDLADADLNATDTDTKWDEGNATTKGGGCAAGGVDVGGSQGIALLCLMLATLSLSTRLLARRQRHSR
jgi:hypothetical protein